MSACKFEVLEPRMLLSGAAAVPVVSIVATDPTASEVGDTGQFTITRSLVTAKALKVKVTIGGTATNGKDYTKCSTTVTIPANAASTTVTISPIDDGLTEPQETVVRTLGRSSSYTADAAHSTATVTIDDATYTAADFWPMTDGQGWYYINKTGGKSFSLQFTDNGGGQFNMALPPDQNDAEGPLGYRLQQTANGLEQVAKHDWDGTWEINSPALPWLPATMAIGQTYTSSFLDNLSNSIHVAGVETVTVPTGTFRCLKITTNLHGTNATTLWLARGVGIVKMVGKGINAVMTASCQTGQWVAESSMGSAREMLTGGVIDGKIYAFGGDPHSLNTLEMYDPQTDTWTPKAADAFSDGVDLCAGAVVDGKLYALVAERIIGNDGNYQTYNTVDVYDPTADAWTTLSAPKPTPVSDGPCVVYNGEIYVFGGEYWSAQKGKDHYNMKPVTAVEAYNPATNTWRYVTKMPSTLLATQAAVVGDKAYILGGGSASFVAQKSPLAFDFTTGKWTTKGLAPIPQPRAGYTGGAAPVIDGKIYLIGGATGRPGVGWTSNRIDIYDPATNTWTAGQNLPTTLFCSMPVVVDTTLYVIGGSTDISDENGGTVANVWGLALE